MGLRKIRKIKSSQISFLIKGWTGFKIHGGVGGCWELYTSQNFISSFSIFCHALGQFQICSLILCNVLERFSSLLTRNCWKIFLLSFLFFVVLILNIYHSKNIYIFYSLDALEIVHCGAGFFQMFQRMCTIFFHQQFLLVCQVRSPRKCFCFKKQIECL